LPDLTERTWNDTFGLSSSQDEIYFHIAKSHLIAPADLSPENSWVFVPRAQNEAHETMLALYHRMRIMQSHSVVGEILLEPFIKSAEYIEARLYDTWRSAFVVRKENSSGQNPSPNLLIDP
jgi:hypothetical protein